MVTITLEQIKELRERTGISIAQCKKALEDASGDMNKAIEFLKEAGAAIAEKKSDRELRAGVISAYLHSNGLMGSMVQLHSETDFVSKNPEFKFLADEIAMHITAMNPADIEELLAQPYIKDPSLTVDQLVKNYVQKFGERIEVIRFSRFATNS